MGIQEYMNPINTSTIQLNTRDHVLEGLETNHVRHRPRVLACAGNAQ